MSLTDSANGSPFSMPVMPAYGYGYGGGNQGNNGFGSDWAWILLLLLIGGNGWGMGGFGMGGMMWPMMMGGFGGGFGLDYLYPWLNNSQHISDGFRDQQLNTQISDARTDINRGFGDVQLGIAGINQNLCQTGNGITSAINNGFSSAEIAANGRQMANMQQLFGIQSAQQQCCCDTRAGIADLRYTVATEACADRAAVGDALQAVTMQGVNNTNTLLTTLRDGIQSIKDQLCSDKIDAKNDTIAQLRSELLYARGQASQDVQTARILAGQAAEIDGVYNRLKNCPVGTVPVFGNQPIFTCPTNVGNNCGCGCGNASF